MTTGNFILKMLNYKRKFKSDVELTRDLMAHGDAREGK